MPQTYTSERTSNPMPVFNYWTEPAETLPTAYPEFESTSVSSEPSMDDILLQMGSWNMKNDDVAPDQQPSRPHGSPEKESKSKLPLPEDIPQPLLQKDQKFNLTLYKTELCRAWQEKRPCKFGDGCLFAHGKEELRQVPRHPKYKTEICRVYHSGGTCPYGVRCRFIHDFNEARTHWAEAWQNWKGQTDENLLTAESTFEKKHRREASLEEEVATAPELPSHYGHKRTNSAEKRLSFFSALTEPEQAQ